MQKTKNPVLIGDPIAETPPAPDAAFESAAAELVAEARQSSEVMAQADLAEALHYNQIIGLTHYARALDSINKIALLKSLQQLKDAKDYKNMILPEPDGGVIKVRTWQQLCDALGLSRSKVDEDLANLAAFGEDVLKAQDSLGIGYRELRGLRGGLAALPADEQAEVRDLIANAAASGDKEELLATLDEVGARNSRLSKELEEARADGKAKDSRISDKGRQIDDLQTRLARLTNPATPEARETLHAEQQDNIRRQVTIVCDRLVGEVSSLCRILAATAKYDSEHPDGLPVLTSPFWHELDERIGAAWMAAADLLTESGLDSVAPAINPADFDDAPTAFEVEPESAHQ
ncbi:MAG TPA: hypothetical protein H9962_07020 [Candidatus Mailhella merdigallinarum]|uniref:Uncharacterized protein n=1 Tax=Candidatus Mailhella merdigallinarum TaxID=2838658 RepID=A0A9D2KKH4_9BACT|nr:hypothetical protein [Candidatus Mailhella merdigallinarum]